MEWCDEKIELLINFSSQNTFLFGVQLSDYHNQMTKSCISVIGGIMVPVSRTCTRLKLVPG